MPHSEAIRYYYPCFNCASIATIDDWVIIDVLERPDLVQLLAQGNLYAKCQQCDRKLGDGSAITLLYEPGRPLIFSSMPNMSEEQCIRNSRSLALRLRDNVNDDWAHGRPGRVIYLYNHELPGYLSGEGIVERDALYYRTDEDFWNGISARLEKDDDKLRHSYLSALNLAVEKYERLYRNGDIKQGSDRVDALFNGHFAQFLLKRYQASGDYVDLEKALSLYRDVVGSQEGYDDTSSRFAGLGNALVLSYERSGNLDDLKECIASYETALERGPSNDTSASAIYTNLGSALLKLFDRLHTDDVLGKAIYANEQAISRTSLGSAALPLRLNNLGISLRYRYHRHRIKEDLLRAIDVLSAAVSNTDQVSHELAARHINLGSCYLDLYSLETKSEYHTQGIEYIENGISHTDPYSPKFPGRQMNLAVALLSRHVPLDSYHDIERAYDLFRSAILKGFEVDIECSLLSAIKWARDAFSRSYWSAVVEAAEHAQQSIDLLLQRQSTRVSKELWLSDFQGLAAYGCYALARQGTKQDLVSAVTILERGRCQMLNELFERNVAALDQLRLSDPDTYSVYRRLTDDLRAIEVDDSPELSGEQSESKQIDISRRKAIVQLRMRLESVIEQIRGTSGFEDFLSSTSFDDFSSVIEESAALVYLVVTSHGSLALILYNDNNLSIAIDPVWADQLDYDTVRGHLVVRSDGVVVGGYVHGQLGNRQSLESSLTELLPLIGDSLIKPLSNRLRKIGVESVVLIPVGVLTSLPLHAAHYRDGKYSANPPLQSCLKIVRDTGGMILYKAGHDKLHPTSSRRHSPRSDWRVRFQAFFRKHNPTDSSRTY